MYCIPTGLLLQYVMLGGEPYVPDVHMYDFAHPELEWQRMPDMPVSKKGAFCGVAVDEDGKISIVVAAGKRVKEL